MSKRKALPPDLSRSRGDHVLPGTPEWNEWVREITEYLGYPVCGAKNRRGIPCTCEATTGRTRCRYHGGKSLIGPAAPSWKTGKHSIVSAALPERFRENYDTLVTDAKLLALESDIAVTDLRQLELMTKLRDSKDPERSVQALKAAVTDLEVAMAEGDEPAIAANMKRIRDALRANVDSMGLWKQWVNLGEHKRKLVESEGRRMERMGLYMGPEEVRAYHQLIIGALTRGAQKHLPLEYARPFLQEVIMEIIMYSGLGPQPDPAALPAHMQLGKGGNP